MILSINEILVSNLTESTQTTKRKGVLKTVEGTFAEANEKNRNDRRYSRRLWEKVLSSDYVKEMLSNNTLFGEALHPPDRSEIALPEVSHVITELKLTPDGRVLGKADILDTPAGRILNTVIEYGSKIGISSRGMGSVNEQSNGERWVDEDSYTFVTFDFVPIPSVAVARPPVSEGAPVTEELFFVPLKESLEAQIKMASPTDFPVIERIVSQIGNPEILESLKHILEERRNIPDYSTLLEEAQHLRASQSDLLSTIERISKEKDRIESSIKEGYSALTSSYEESLKSTQEESNSLKETLGRLKGRLMTLQLENKSLEELSENLIESNKKIQSSLSSSKPSTSEKLLQEALDNSSKTIETQKQSLSEMNNRYVDLGTLTEKYVERNKDLVSIISEIVSVVTGTPSAKVKESLQPMFTSQDIMRLITSASSPKKMSVVKAPNVKESRVQILKEAIVYEGTPSANKEEKVAHDQNLVNLIKRVRM